MNRGLLGITLGLMCLVGAPGAARAQLAARCFGDDYISSTTVAQGRNAWAVKCGYMSAARANVADIYGEYAVFSSGCNAYPNVAADSGCRAYVPVSADEGCVSGLLVLGYCQAGCYTPEQRLVFGGGFEGIAAAYRQGAPTVAGLSAESAPGALRFTEQPILTFVAGETKEEIWVLRTEDGRRLEVTSEHPMVTGDGRVVRARTLLPGDSLLGADGMAVTLRDVEIVPFEGTVWNVRPRSTEKVENILDAEGLLTGSVRFQNDWANDDYRLSVRDEADVAEQ